VIDREKFTTSNAILKFVLSAELSDGTIASCINYYFYVFYKIKCIYLRCLIPKLIEHKAWVTRGAQISSRARAAPNMALIAHSKLQVIICGASRDRLARGRHSITEATDVIVLLVYRLAVETLARQAIHSACAFCFHGHGCVASENIYLFETVRSNIIWVDHSRL